MHTMNETVPACKAAAGEFNLPPCREPTSQFDSFDSLARFSTAARSGMRPFSRYYVSSQRISRGLALAHKLRIAESSGRVSGP